MHTHTGTEALVSVDNDGEVGSEKEQAVSYYLMTA